MGSYLNMKLFKKLGYSDDVLHFIESANNYLNICFDVENLISRNAEIDHSMIIDICVSEIKNALSTFRDISFNYSPEMVRICKEETFGGVFIRARESLFGDNGCISRPTRSYTELRCCYSNIQDVRDKRLVELTKLEDYVDMYEKCSDISKHSVNAMMDSIEAYITNRGVTDDNRQDTLYAAQTLVMIDSIIMELLIDIKQTAQELCDKCINKINKRK